MSAPAPYRAGTIAIVGRPNAGKSTLLNHLVGQKISITSRKPQTTRQRILGIHTEADAQYIFVDTPGFQTRHPSALTRLMNQSVTVAVSDVDAIVHVIEAGHWDAGDEQVAKLLSGDIPVVLALNKIDHLKDKARLGALIQERAAQFPYAALVPISAQKGTQLKALLGELRKLLPEQPAIYPEDELTDRSERFMAAEFIREKLFRLLGERVALRGQRRDRKIRAGRQTAPHFRRGDRRQGQSKRHCAGRGRRENETHRDRSQAGSRKALRRQGLSGSVCEGQERLGRRCARAPFAGV